MKKRLALAINPLVMLIEGFILCGKNAIFKSKLIAARIIETAIQGLSFEALYQLTQCLSADRILEKVHSFSEEQIMNLILKGTKTLQLPKKIIAALDFTEKEYYGDKNHKQIIGSKGGKYVQRFIELSIVKPALFVNALMVDQFTNNKVKLITQLIDGFDVLFKKTKIELLLLDRGFFTKAVVKLLNDKGKKFIIPAIKNREIKYMVEGCFKMKKSLILDYQFGKTKVYLVFVRIDNEVLVYMTNTKFNPLKVHLLYKKRWQIETNFREQNQFMLRTTTKSFEIRYLAFAIAGLLFNAWQLQRLREGQVRGYVFRKEVEHALGFCWVPFVNQERG
jgi:hypothetical protein